MPDARPLSSMLRLGAYDEPPASSEASTPQTRRGRLRRALQATNELGRDPAATHMDPARVPGRAYLAPSTRRRRRSESTHGDELSSTADVTGTAEHARQRNKRRRIGRSTSPPSRKSVKYGYYGQVEAGRLKLALVSCDGGEHRDSRHPTQSLGPENLLRHDKSVYCSERSYCNIVLQHVDDTPFCLEKLHIIGPEHGFTAPVREGLAYVAMTMGDLQKYVDPPRYARRHGAHSPPFQRRRERSVRSSPEQLTFAEALRDQEVNVALNERHRDQSRRGDVVENVREGEYYGSDYGFGRTDPQAHCEIPTSSDMPEIIVTSEDSPDRRITILSDEEPGPEDSSSQEVLDYRLQRLRLARRRFEFETWDREERWSGLNRLPPNVERERESSALGLNALMARSSVHDSASPEPEPWTRRDIGLRALEEGWEDENIMCARFKIKRGKHRVAIRFDPPISGRFVLLKIWANSSNVDVQSVVAKGFGGGRFFPAISMR